MLLAKQFYFACALTLTLSGCASTTQEIGNDDLLAECFATALVEGAQAGVQFTNNCEACVAVAFETQSNVFGDSGDNACYVPAKTRVVFSGVSSYGISVLQDCDRVEKAGSIDGVSAAKLTENYKSGRCAIVGEYDD